MRSAILFALLAASCAPRPGPGGGFSPAGGGPGDMRGRLFISPMGEPFRSATRGADLVRQWFSNVDGNADGVIVAAEMQMDADRFFTLLDTDADGEIEPVEMTRYEEEIVPEVRLAGQFRGRPPGGGMPRGGPGGGGMPGGGGPGGGMGGGSGGEPPRRPKGPMGPQGAGLFGLINIPQPVASADANLNRGVSRDEFRRAAEQRFILLDTDHSGRVAIEELPRQPAGQPGRRPIE